MITTITTVTTVTTIAVAGLTAAISIAAVVSLVAFLTTKELAGTGHFRSSLRIAKFVNIGILPLAIAFAVIVAVKILGA